MRSTLLSLLVLATTLMTGCRIHQDVHSGSVGCLPPGLQEVRVAHIFNSATEPAKSGTAIPIGGDMLASCRHNFPPQLQSLWIDGKMAPITMLWSGESDDQMLEDWCVFQVPPGVATVDPGTRIDFKRTVKAGETIYLIGFYGGPKHGISRETALNLPKTIVMGTVVEAPKEWRQFQEEIIFVDAPEPDAYHGISGGAAVVFDPDSSSWVVVGVYRGAVVESHEFLGFSRQLRTYHTIRRLPELK